MFLVAQVFEHSCCSSSFRAGLDLKLSTEKHVRFLLQIVSSVPAFRDIYLHLLVQKKISTTISIIFSSTVMPSVLTANLLNSQLS